MPVKRCMLLQAQRTFCSTANMCISFSRLGETNLLWLEGSWLQCKLSSTVFKDSSSQCCHIGQHWKEESLKTVEDTCNLHLFLRVADRLIDILIIELKRLDAIQKAKKFSLFDRVKCRHLAKFEEFVSSLGIPDFQFYVGRTSKQLKCRTLSGPKKLKIFDRISIKELLPSLPESDVAKRQHLWTEFLRIFFKTPRASYSRQHHKLWGASTKWGKDFISVYHDHNITWPSKVWKLMPVQSNVASKPSKELFGHYKLKGSHSIRYRKLLG